MSTDVAVNVEELESLFEDYLEANRNNLAESTLHAYRTRFTAFLDWYVDQEVTNPDR